MPTSNVKRRAIKQSPKGRSKNKDKNGDVKPKKPDNGSTDSSTKRKFLLFIFLHLCVGAGIYYWRNFSYQKEVSKQFSSNEKPTQEDGNSNSKSPDAEFTNQNSDFEVNILDKITLSPLLSESGGVIRAWKELKPTKNIKESSVRVYVMDNFLSSYECEGLMKAHESHVAQTKQHDPIVCFTNEVTMASYLRLAKVSWSKKVSSKDFTQGTRCLNESLSAKLKGKLPWSYSTSFYPGESKFSTVYSEKVEKYTGLSTLNGGKFQVTSYEKEVGYKIHTDCVEGNTDLRDRYATILVYLKDVPQGGETEFIDLGIKVKPRKGRALVWNNMNAKGQCDLTSYHKANPVLMGKKYILQRWYYYHNFPMLGMRADPPRYPIRSHEFTPRVMCDKFESGSCRWYDEWNYDHLTNISFV